MDSIKTLNMPLTGTCYKSLFMCHMIVAVYHKERMYCILL